MGDILIRNLDDETISALKLRAKENGRSLQAELHAELQKLASQMRAKASIEKLREIRAMVDVSKLPDDWYEQARDERDARP